MSAGAAARFLTRLLRPRRSRPEEAGAIVSRGDVRRILAIKSHDQLGDFLVATPALAALRARFPEARVVLVTRDYLAPLARQVPGLDEVWVLPRGGARDVPRWLRLCALVAALRPDLAIVLNSVSRSKTADTLAAMSRARLVVGRSRVGAGPLSSRVTQDPAAAAPRDPVYDLDLGFEPLSHHQVDRLLDLVRWTGATSDGAMRLSVPAPERASAARTMSAAFAPSPVPERIVGLHPGAANPLKCWPLESFAELGAALGKGEAAPGLAVFDSPSERGRAAALCAGLESRGVRAAFLPASGIDAFAALCARLDLLICNDSGVMHVAAALGVPTVSFHSLGDPREWAPRGPSAVALHAPLGIEAIPWRAGLEAAAGLLATASSATPESRPVAPASPRES